MNPSSPTATWLDLAIARLHRERPLECRLHHIAGYYEEGREPCYALSVDGRWLCASDGHLTIFQGHRAAEHFMELIGLSFADADEEIDYELGGDCDSYCLRMPAESAGDTG